MPSPLETAAAIFKRLADSDPIGPCDHCAIPLTGHVTIADDGAQLCELCASAIARPAREEVAP